MTVQIRPLTLADAEQVAQLYTQSANYLIALGDQSDFRFDAAVYRRDGFGPTPAFAGIGAELAGELVGYLLYTFGYDTDRAIRTLVVLDLLVDGEKRGQGIGKALMMAAKALCQAAGGGELFWGVYAPNVQALRFYKALGADEVTDIQFMTLKV